MLVSTPLLTKIEHETHDSSYETNSLGSKNKAPKLNENRVAAASDGECRFQLTSGPGV